MCYGITEYELSWWVKEDYIYLLLLLFYKTSEHRNAVESQKQWKSVSWESVSTITSLFGLL